MAEEKIEGGGEAPKSKMKLIIIIVLVLVLAIAGGAAALLMGGKKKGKDHGDGSGADAEPAKTVTVPFEEKFTVNLRSDDGGNHFMQVPKIELEVKDATVAKEIEEKKAKISDRISSELRSKSMAEMMEAGSDKKLKEELKGAINQVLEHGKGVEEVILPQSFIVQ